jgi:hypothetical protein
MPYNVQLMTKPAGTCCVNHRESPRQAPKKGPPPLPSSSLPPVPTPRPTREPGFASSPPRTSAPDRAAWICIHQLSPTPRPRRSIERCRAPACRPGLSTPPPIWTTRDPPSPLISRTSSHVMPSPCRPLRDTCLQRQSGSGTIASLDGSRRLTPGGANLIY